MDGYFTTLVGLQEVVFNGMLKGGAVRGGARWMFPILASGSAPYVVQRIVGTQGVPAIAVEPPGTENMAYWGKGVLVEFLVRRAVLCQEVPVRGRLRVGFLWPGRGWRGYGWSAGFRSNRP